MVTSRGSGSGKWNTEGYRKYARGGTAQRLGAGRGGWRENRSERELRSKEEEKGRNISGQNASTLPGSWDLSTRERLHKCKSC